MHKRANDGVVIGVVLLSLGLGIASQGCSTVSCQEVRDPACVCPSGVLTGCPMDSSSPFQDGALTDAEASNGDAIERTPDATTESSAETGADAPIGQVPDADAGVPDAVAEVGVICANQTATVCNGACFDLTNDPVHCGSCTNTCAPPSAYGRAACSPGSDGGPSCGIRCDTGYHACGGACLSDSDPPSVTTDPCVVSDSFGVFVSPTGSDSNAGTMASPVLSLSRAMDLAKAANKRVYACGGVYREAIALGVSRDGINVYGGFDCSALPWSYSPSKLALVSPAAAGYALHATGLSQGVVFEDFGFEASDATASGESSIAVFVSNSSSMRFRRCSVRAALGMAGQDGAPPAAFGAPAPNGQAGTSASGGGSTANPLCPTSVGGAGAPPTRGHGASGSPGLPGAPNGGTETACQNSLIDSAGADGQPGSMGAGASTSASVSTTGWTPTAGQPGSVGGVGQGGGGGASLGVVVGIVVPGAGGAAGGCGGAGGVEGAGGGSSVALLAYASTVALESCTLTTGNAGRGGNGAAGQTGQAPGAGAKPVGECPGGPGGSGGSGGPGGGGAGGVSAGVVWSGLAPVLNGSPVSSASTLSSITVGTPGAGGTGAGTGNDGTAGVAQAVVHLQ